MYKKLLIVFIILLLCSGCINNKKIIKKEKIIEDSIPEVKYVDKNNTPISFYSSNDSGLIKLTKINKTLVPLEDVGIFQIYPSNEESVYFTDGFGASFYNEWMKYNTNNNLKIGFNIKFNTDTEEISYNILAPSNTFDKWEYLLNYLYDDYANRNKSFYSHIENDEYNESTLFTSFKMQSNDRASEIKDKILLTVFTYDSPDDFLDNEYRGNSKSTLTICVSDNC